MARNHGGVLGARDHGARHWKPKNMGHGLSEAGLMDHGRTRVVDPSCSGCTAGDAAMLIPKVLMSSTVVDPLAAVSSAILLVELVYAVVTSCFGLGSGRHRL